MGTQAMYMQRDRGASHVGRAHKNQNLQAFHQIATWKVNYEFYQRNVLAGMMVSTVRAISKGVSSVTAMRAIPMDTEH